MPLASEFPSVNCGSQLPLEACFVSGGQKWLLHFYTCLFFVILPILHSFLFFFGVEKVGKNLKLHKSSYFHWFPTYLPKFPPDSPSGMKIFELAHQASGAAVVTNTDGCSSSRVLSKSDVEDLKSMQEVAIS